MGHKKLHLRSNAVQFSLFIIKNGTDIRRLNDDEQPLLRLRRYENMDIKFAFLSTMSSFNLRMRNVAFQRWLAWKLSFNPNPSCDLNTIFSFPSTASSSNPAITATDSKAKLTNPDMPDLSDGLVLMDLMTVLNIPALGKFNKKPKTPKEKFKNLNIALISLRSAGCIVPEHVTPEQLR